MDKPTTTPQDAEKLNPVSNTSTINLTTRHERSLYTYLIHTVVRLFRNKLGRPKKYQPNGSVELKVKRSAKRHCNVEHHTICDIHVYDIMSKPLTAQKRNTRLYYFCGGGWQSPPSSQHWQLCVRMARGLPGTTVTLVSYPLAPNNPASSAFPWLLRFYRAIMEMASEAGDKVILAGDSSGANIVLCLTLEALREDAETGDVLEAKRQQHPVALLANCPSTDLTRKNPDIEKLAGLDPILTPDFVNETAKAWTGDWDASDRRVSPLNADLSLLCKNDVTVHGITAGHDILSPDGILFRDHAAKHGVKGEWLHWEKQMHCFCLTAGYGVPEGKEAVDWAMKLLSKE
jgi:acetyl esterase/lipase